MYNAVLPSEDENIRKIEDIIDIQKANGNFNNTRQVAFLLPSDQEVAPDYVKSLESGLAKNKFDNGRKKKNKKNPSKQGKNIAPDTISWPSDSDITVLRMKLCLTKKNLNEKLGNTVPGDGLHQHDSSSMVNLATLMRQSQTPSKHSIAMEEYLLPLTSWEQQIKDPTEEKINYKVYNKTGCSNFDVYEAMCSRIARPKESEWSITTSRKSKIARFLRLYFCPCCSCLYKLETMKDDPSAYFSKQK